MTSLAFILGVLPLAISTGAGSASRHSIGTGVIGGMIAATFVAILFVPLFFRLLTRRGKGKARALMSVSPDRGPPGRCRPERSEDLIAACNRHEILRFARMTRCGPGGPRSGKR